MDATVNATIHRILVAHRNDSRRIDLRSMLESIGHVVVGEASTHSEVVGLATETAAEVIVSSLRLSDGDGIAALIEVSREQPLPSVIVTPRSDLAHVQHALEDHVMAYLVEPITAEDLRPTIALVMSRFAQFQELQKEVEDLKTALTARKVIERAKGMVMKEHALDEQTAYRNLQKLANAQRRKLVEVAEDVLRNGTRSSKSAVDGTNGKT